MIVMVNYIYCGIDNYITSWLL